MAAAFFAALLAIALTCAPSANGAKTSNNVVDETFDAFAKRLGRSYKPDSGDYAMRVDLYEKRLNEVLEHNGKSGKSYKVTLNHFSDLTDQERKKYLGLRPTAKKAPTGASMLEIDSTGVRGSKGEDEVVKVNAPDAMDWSNLTVATGMWENGLSRIPDQGSCGSCWAVAATALLEAHLEIKLGARAMKHLSAQELVNCVQNPHSCGGTGGCAGATVELAMEYVKEHGLSEQSQIPYTGTDETCHTQQSGVLADGIGGALGGGLGAAGMVSGHTTLAANQAQPLKDAMYTHGPVALSVAAGGWFSYNDGVFDGCPQHNEMVIDHAVLGYGYAPDYWKIRNSWGPNWGEKGFIRLARVANEDQHCSTDNHPEQGIGCTNPSGPSSMIVCGMCGVLMDSVYPHFSSVLLQEKQAVVVDGAAVVRNILRSRE